MDLNLKALIGITYLIPIAITLRKIYTPSFDMPEPIAIAVAKLESARASRPARSDISSSLELQS